MIHNNCVSLLLINMFVEILLSVISIKKIHLINTFISSKKGK